MTGEGEAESGADFVRPEVGAEGFGDRHGAVFALEVLQDGDERAAHGESGAVQRVDELGLLSLGAAEANRAAARLERLEVRAGGDLAVGVLPGEPDFQV